MLRSGSERLSTDQYLRLGLSHRFCLIARGDFASTKKITEAMALGAAGGCLPIIVIPEDSKLSKAKTATPGWGAMTMLPFVRWFPYCAVGCVVHERVASANFSVVLEHLHRVTAAEASMKRAALRRLVHAFIVRPRSRVEQPSAAEYVLDEVCHLASQRRRQLMAGGAHLSTNTATRTPGWIREAGVAAKSSLEKCTIGRV